MLLLRGRVQGLPASVWLEGFVGALALASVGATAVFDPVVASTHGSLSTVATNLAYPAADVLLLAIIAGGFALLRHRVGASWMLLGAALLLFTLGDTVYLVRAAEGTYREGSWVDATWPLAMALIAVAAWTRNRPPSALTEQDRPWVGRALGAVFGTLVVGELLLESIRKAPVVAHLLLVAAVVALLLRLLISARERTQLERTRIEARTDELTGLSNRRHFYERAEDWLAQGPAALVLLDLNHFKEINETPRSCARRSSLVAASGCTRSRRVWRPPNTSGCSASTAVTPPRATTYRARSPPTSSTGGWAGRKARACLPGA